MIIMIRSESDFKKYVQVDFPNKYLLSLKKKWQEPPPATMSASSTLNKFFHCNAVVASRLSTYLLENAGC